MSGQTFLFLSKIEKKSKSISINKHAKQHYEHEKAGLGVSVVWKGSSLLHIRARYISQPSQNQ